PQLEKVHRAAVEGKQPRRILFDDADLDAADDRQLLAGVGARDSRITRLAAGAGYGIRFVSVTGAGLEHDLLPAHPVLQPVRSRADRMLHDAIRRVLVRLDHFTRDRGEPVVAQPVLERVVGRVEAYAQRVAIDRLQTFDLRVVVEAVGLARTLQGRVETDEPTIEEIEPIRAQLRIEDALDAVYIILRDELALPALERRIVGEVDAGPHLHRERAPAVGALRHALGRVGDEAQRAGHIVIGVERREARGADCEEIRSVDRLR